MNSTKGMIKSGKIGVLINENADKWFWLVESYLREKDLWEVIKDVINIRKLETKYSSPLLAETAGLTLESISDPPILPLLLLVLQEKFTDKD